MAINPEIIGQLEQKLIEGKINSISHISDQTERRKLLEIGILQKQQLCDIKSFYFSVVSRFQEFYLCSQF